MKNESNKTNHQLIHKRFDTKGVDAPWAKQNIKKKNPNEGGASPAPLQQEHG
jgi:hypothetical protein